METLFPEDWLKIAGSAIFFTSPGSAFALSRLQLPTIIIISASFVDRVMLIKNLNVVMSAVEVAISPE
jgi:hypothetical protein